MELSHRDVFADLGTARRPGDFEPINAGGLAQAEMKPPVGGGEVASPADYGPEHRPSSDGGLDLYADFRRLEVDRERMPWIADVPEDGSASVQRVDDGVQIAVVVEVADG